MKSSLVLVVISGMWMMCQADGRYARHDGISHERQRRGVNRDQDIQGHRYLSEEKRLQQAQDDPEQRHRHHHSGKGNTHGRWDPFRENTLQHKTSAFGGDRLEPDLFVSLDHPRTENTPPPANIPDRIISVGGFEKLALLAASSSSDPPPHQDTAAMARYIVHNVDWTAIATKSSRDPIRTLPFASLFSVSDGFPQGSTGVPYMYLSSLDVSVQDLRIDSRASLSMSLVQTPYCRQRRYDPQSPLCAHVILTGHVLQMNSSDADYSMAHDALFSQHPEMAYWPSGHHFFVAKLDIEHVFVLDFFGGMKSVEVADYFKADPSSVFTRHANTL